MKKPQGVYVHEVKHAEAARLVENSLDEHGTLAGFIDFIETALYSVAHTAPADHKKHSDEELKAVREHAEAPKEFSINSVGGSAARFRDADMRFGWYEEAWSELAAHLPWEEEEPAAHAFALYLLSRDRRLWEADVAYDRPPAASRFAPSLRTLLTDFIDAGKGAGSKLWQDSGYKSQEKPLPAVWRGNTLEVFLDEPKAKSTSFYLEPEAHEFTINIFDRGLFDRIERGLLRILNNSTQWLHLEPHFQFLEHGLSLLDYQEPVWTQEDADNFRLFKGFQEGVPLDSLENEALEAEYLDDLIFGGFSWTARSGSEFETSYRLTAFHNSILLAHRLGLTSLEQEVDLGEIRTKLLPAFLQRYHLDRLAPERPLAYQVIKHSSLPAQKAYVTNAVDYHLLRLFQAYALQTLPMREREARRVHPATLATLAQPWVFPTRTTLEWYSNTKANKTANGTWQLNKGRKMVLELSDAEAYWTAYALNTVFTTQPGRSKTQSLVEGEEYLEAHQGDPALENVELSWPRAWAETLEQQGQGRASIRLPLSTELVERARKLIRPQLPKPDAIGSGLLVTAELTDETLKADGKFATAFLSRISHDTSALPPEAEETK